MLESMRCGPLVFLAFAIPRLASDRANAEWREKNKPSVGVVPVAWTSGRGDGAFGLALGGSF
jgi:hypothetical protein